MIYGCVYRGYDIAIKGTTMIEHTEEGLPLGYMWRICKARWGTFRSSEAQKNKAWALRKASAEIDRVLTKQQVEV